MGRPKGQKNKPKKKKWTTTKRTNAKKNTKLESDEKQVEIVVDPDSGPRTATSPTNDGERELQVALRVSGVSEEVITDCHSTSHIPQIDFKFDGFTYKAEEERLCPICHDKLMWYVMPDEMEIRVCRSVSCDYPFCVDNPSHTPESYEIRFTNHGKTKHGDQQPLSITSSANANTSMSLVKYTGGGTSNYQHQEELAKRLLEEYRKGKGRIDKLEPFFPPEQFIDVDQVKFLNSTVLEISDMALINKK